MFDIKDEIDAIIKHHFNGAEREDLTEEYLQCLDKSIDVAVQELVELFRERG